MDPITSLASQLVTLLAPLLPQLTTVAGDIAGQLESTNADLIGRIWARLRPKADSKPAFDESLKDAAAQPDDDDARAALRMQLKKLLTEDPSLAKELRQLLEQAGQSVNVTASGTRSVAVGHDVSGSTIITGDSNRLSVDKPPRDRPKS
jgi:hypothetical protein